MDPANTDDPFVITVDIEEEQFELNVGTLSHRIMDTKKPNSVPLLEIEIIALCKKCKEIFDSQPILLELHAPMVIVGGINGHFPELVKWFGVAGYPTESNYLFLGSYVNRGLYSIETICLLFCYKIMFPLSFYLLRGKHETLPLMKAYGFLDECRHRYNTQVGRLFVDVFNHLPLAALIESKIFCCHGGLSPDLHNFDQVKKLPRPVDVFEGFVCDLLWADPNKEEPGWGVNPRGISVTFGSEILAKFMVKHELDLICRSNELVEDGYEFFSKKQLLTLFSAPNFCGEYDNSGAVLCVNDALVCTLKIVRSKAYPTSQPKPKSYANLKRDFTSSSGNL